MGGITTVTNVNVTLSDTAGFSMSDNLPLTSGTYRPTNFGGSDVFNGPAPLPSGATRLGTFYGASAGGTWKLWVMDDVVEDVGAIAKGWCVRLEELPQGCLGKAKGDVNADGVIDINDVFSLINSLFAGGGPPLCPADVDSNGLVSVADVFYLINYLFSGGPGPL